tara:strand:- start:703 stop:3588 length:2886 start_codon:yes stop_codon:yes gene_type:complete
MIDVQLYIENNRVDLFDDETIELTSTIQDIRDISKIFADYSKTFTVPANERNNKIFKHFYNPDIEGFDGTVKKPAKIELNHAPFREGFIYIQAANLKNNIANTYTLIFFGGLIQLKDDIKENKLSSLISELSVYDHDYTAANVQTGFISGLSDGNIIYPLITSEKRLFLDSVISSSADENYNGNLFSAPSPDTARGLAYTDLKPAIKVIKILKAIETKYNIKFSDFFDTEDGQTQAQLQNLYLWLSRESGEIISYSNTGTGVIKQIPFTDFTTSNPNSALTFVNNTWSFATTYTERKIQDNIRNPIYTEYFIAEVYLSSFVPTTASVTIKVIDEITGSLVGEQTLTPSSIGAQFWFRHYYRNNKRRNYRIKFVAESDSGASFEASVKLIKRYINFGKVSTLDIESTFTVFNNQSASTIDKMVVTQQMPDIKILDFLTGLFKMFNLTAYVQEPVSSTPVIEVKPLDDYYNDAILNTSKGTIDVADYIDSEAHSVKPSKLFNKINFQYEETNTVLMEQHTALHNKVFGNSSFPPVDEEPFDIVGEEYNVEVPFSHLKYERLYDLGVAGVDTEIQWGYAAGGTFSHDSGATPPTGNYSPEKIEPLLFYGINETIPSGNKRINWISGTAVGLSQYWRPSNSNEAGTSEIAPSFTLNFDNEFDEWNRIDYSSIQTGVTGETDSNNSSLFLMYYKKYIQSIYDYKKRLFNYISYLPAKILTTYKLNDQLKLHDRLFHINSITTNLTTGESNLELINLTPEVEEIIPDSFEEPTLGVEEVALGYHPIRGMYIDAQHRACKFFTSKPITMYISSSSSPVTFENAEFLYQDPSGTIPNKGIYSNGVIMREFRDGKFNSNVSIANCILQAPSDPAWYNSITPMAYSSVSSQDALNNLASSQNLTTNAYWWNPLAQAPLNSTPFSNSYEFGSSRYLYYNYQAQPAIDGWYAANRTNGLGPEVRQSLSGIIQV